ncbi:pyridoxamine 5'-phosphate oxidase family protein [Saccharopolyspora erythraea]|uniref:pyridoxamine 5'-phosphate oxidase family protein n=1 Tax=Saccharopolyspora erythraea TaxID=1836 RepID=UPI001BAD7FCC|nr:pyridoxamine 5'-phosphate oxidase family protein [Saccharopolyspora erythraea]
MIGANLVPVVSWKQFSAEEPRIAADVRRRFGASRHHVLATLRRDGSPRLSAIEVHWRDDVLELWSMPGSHKALDLLRDPRMSVHAQPGEASLGEPDVKLSGRALEVADPSERRAWIERAKPASEDSHLFRVEITEVVTTGVDEAAGHLLIKLWRPSRGVVVFRRH